MTRPWIAIALAAALVGCRRPPPVAARRPAKPLENLSQLPLAPPGEGRLKGSVSAAGGEPIAAGRLFFLCAEGLVPRSFDIRPDGTYEAAGLPEGRLDVCVLTDPEGPLPFPVDPRLFAVDPTFVPRRTPLEPDADPPAAGRPPFAPRRPAARGVDHISPVPPAVAAALRDYSIPPGQGELYRALHVKYGAPGPRNPLSVYLQGAATYAIVLE